jgi:endonuclease-3
VPEVQGQGEDLDRRTAVRSILERLRPLFGPPPLVPDHDPVGTLVSTILSQHTSDRNADRAFDRLVARYGTDWTRVATAPLAELIATIACSGLARVKASRIQAVLRAIPEHFPDAGLASLTALPVAEARRRLTALPGVGPKTASCVLLFGLGMPALPVDTHVHRVARRLGLIDPTTSAEEAHAALEAIVAPSDVHAMHVCLIRLGREICQARYPRCSICPLNDLCPSARVQDTRDVRADGKGVSRS